MELQLRHKEPLGIYIHIPFCVKKCDYCDFFSMKADTSVKDDYITALGNEIRAKINTGLFQKYKLNTIFIGGGTPTCLLANQLEKLGTYIDCIIDENAACNGKKDKIEITVECNPGTIDEEKAAILKKHYVNRISLGLQSANNDELKNLGRIHTFEDFLEAFKIIRNAGIQNINVDLMSALPYQTIESWEYTLRKTAALFPEHISAYSLIIEEGTAFYDKYRSDEKVRDMGDIPKILPSEDVERKMYELTKKILSEYSYERYEISNYAKPGRECKHNIGYWKLDEYMGIGAGAVSMMTFDEKIKRFNNTTDIKAYIANDFCMHDCEDLTKKIRMEEFMFMGLRMIQGVSTHRFYEKFKVSVNDIYGNVINKLIFEKLLEKTPDERICLTNKGLDLGNYVFEQFIL